jgi:hypothetical protein
MNWRKYFSGTDAIFATPLLYAFMIPIYELAHMDPFLILKFIQPTLYGLLILSFYYAVGKLLKWGNRKSFFTATIFSLQTPLLRISWDQLRNELGLAMDHLSKKEFERGRNLTLASIPSVLLFLGVIYHSFWAPRRRIFANVIGIPSKRSLPPPFINYLAGEGFVDYKQSYFYLLTDVWLLFIASYILILPFIVYGIKKRERVLDLWTIWCSFGSFMCLMSPHFALFGWWRWMTMLVIPFTFYAINGIEKVRSVFIRRDKKKLCRSFTFLLCIIYAFIAISYLASSWNNPILTYALIYPSSKYSPTTMLRHTAPLEDTPSIIRALNWLDEHMEDNSCLLVKDTFFHWVTMYLSEDKVIINYGIKNVEEGLKLARGLGYEKIYWIWWEDGVGLRWYGQLIPKNFEPVYRAGGIVIYMYSQVKT